MTAPDTRQDNRAAAFFAGLLTLALGGAGLIIAALAVGAERAWNGGNTEGARQRERGRGWFATQQAWLDQDHQARVARATARRDWLNSGADPTTAPARAPRSTRLGRGLHRVAAHVAVAASDFTQGVRDGWRAANQVRHTGGGFRDIAAARPLNTWSCPGCGLGMTKARADEMTVEEVWCPTCRATQFPRTPTPPTSPAPPAGEKPVPQNVPAPDPDDVIVKRPLPATETPGTPGATVNPTPSKEEPMTDNTTTSSSPQQPATESNAAVLRMKLNNIKTTLDQIADLTDQLSAERNKLEQQVRDAGEFAEVTGQTAQARQALDESNALAVAMGTKLGDFSQGAVSAEDAVAQAAAGLKVAEDAEDQLRSAGADGRAVAPAGANA